MDRARDTLWSDPRTGKALRDKAVAHPRLPDHDASARSTAIAATRLGSMLNDCNIFMCQSHQPDDSVRCHRFLFHEFRHVVLIVSSPDLLIVERKRKLVDTFNLRGDLAGLFLLLDRIRAKERARRRRHEFRQAQKSKPVEASLSPRRKALRNATASRSNVPRIIDTKPHDSKTNNSNASGKQHVSTDPTDENTPA